jgi:nucleotide-binding universal stress UspA family protein
MARARSILVVYDGSGAGRRALEAAADLAGYGSTLDVIASDGSHLARARHHLTGRHTVARYLGARADVVQAAWELGTDLIVVARDGSLDVAGQAPCDVLLVR